MIALVSSNYKRCKEKEIAALKRQVQNYKDYLEEKDSVFRFEVFNENVHVYAVDAHCFEILRDKITDMICAVMFYDRFHNYVGMYKGNFDAVYRVTCQCDGHGCAEGEEYQDVA